MSDPENTTPQCTGTPAIPGVMPDALHAFHVHAWQGFAQFLGKMSAAGHEFATTPNVSKLVNEAVKASATKGQIGGTTAPNYADHALHQFFQHIAAGAYQFATAHLPAELLVMGSELEPEVAAIIGAIPQVQEAEAVLRAAEPIVNEVVQVAAEAREAAQAEQAAAPVLESTPPASDVPEAAPVAPPAT
jgi:hypothetical protein